VTRSLAPHDLPVVPEELQPAYRLVTRGAERADAAEVATNPRAASVRLRAIERIKEAKAV
jgi:16S rRNA (cytosine1402-N4)-methyltransferase